MSIRDSLPGVQYFTGQVLPIDEVVAAGHEVGALVGFDLAHAVGNIALDIHDWGVDFDVYFDSLFGCTLIGLRIPFGSFAGSLSDPFWFHLASFSQPLAHFSSTLGTIPLYFAPLGTLWAPFGHFGISWDSQRCQNEANAS